MMGFIFYYPWILVDLYLIYVLFACSYKGGKRVKREMWKPLLFVVLSIIPGLNLICLVSILVMMVGAVCDDGIEFRTFLFRKV